MPLSSSRAAACAASATIFFFAMLMPAARPVHAQATPGQSPGAASTALNRAGRVKAILSPRALRPLPPRRLPVLRPIAVLRPPPQTSRKPPAGPLMIPPWTFSLGGTLSAAQAAYNNWTEGGLNTLALTAGVDGKAERTSGTWTQTHELRLALGFLKQDTLSVRKADDLIRLASAFRYKGDGFFQTFNPTLSATLRTQFARGFNYDKVPKELQPSDGTRTPPVQVSGFLSPGVLTESLGLTAEPWGWLVQRVGVASKQTIVWDPEVRPLYDFSAARAVRVQAGLSSTTEVNRELLENVRLKSSLGLFAAFNQVSETPDVTWENVVTANLNRYLSVNFEFTTLYDPNLSPDPQVKQSLSLGVRVVMI